MIKNHFYNVDSVTDAQGLVQAVLKKKEEPVSAVQQNGKTMVLLFFNNSLRTRLSTEIAAQSLGLQVVTMDMSKSWKWEIDNGTVMDADSAEHIKDAVRVICSYADIIGVRAFAGLHDKEEDYADTIIKSIMQYSTVPVINMESAILHPLQSLADMVTINEIDIPKPRVVLTWAPHPRALPQAVSNSFLEWSRACGHEVTVCQPEGFELEEQFTNGHSVVYSQEKAFKDADIIYTKNWSSVTSYGNIGVDLSHWIIDESKMALTANAKFMHCMPIRRNVVATDKVLDSSNNLMYQQAENRLHSAKVVIESLIQK